MSDFFTHTNFAGPIHTLVQIGAQGMQDIEEALHIDPAQIVLTTMDPDLAQKADDAFATWRTADKTAQVDHVAVTAKRARAATSQVQLFENPALATRKKPTGLQTLCPGLTATRQATVPDIAISAFFKALPTLPDGARHMLRFGLTGDEQTLLAAMSDKMAGRFHDIIISLPPAALFDRAPTGDVLRARLYDLGFLPVAQRAGPVPGIPECHLIQSPHHAALQTCLAADRDRQREHAEQKTALKTLTRERDALRKALDQTVLDTRDLDALRTRYAALMADYETQSDTLRQVQARVKAALARFEA